MIYVLCMEIAQHGEALPQAPQADGEASAPTKYRARGMQIGRWRARYLPSNSPNGFGHDEGDATSRSLVELALLYEAGVAKSLRLVLGRHSLWLFW